MSATLRVEDFISNCKLFPTPPPLVNVEARQFKVTNHFSRITEPDYIAAAFSKVSQIHRKLPPGGILVFLTGQSEIIDLCKKLSSRYPSSASSNNFSGLMSTRTLNKNTVGCCLDEDADYAEGLNEYLPASSHNEDLSGGDSVSDEDADMKPLWVLPLYSALNPVDQQKVFQIVPEGHRLCVVSTNVAETSLTIPNIKYVIDCGRVKSKIFDFNTGMEKYEVVWISKASANQRSGRAGRTEEGHCYRLYSSAVYENEFKQFSEPEVLSRPLEGVILLMKSMGIDNVVNFPFPTPPLDNNLLHAEKVSICLLSSLKA
jgi:ATP-dependent RNA helicase DHX37/DHR1